METFLTQGVCAQKISFQIENNCLAHVEFQGGCNGNLKGICNLVEGMPVAEVIKRLKGIRCGAKETSCPDQLAAALEQNLGCTK